MVKKNISSKKYIYLNSNLKKRKMKNIITILGISLLGILTSCAIERNESSNELGKTAKSSDGTSGEIFSTPAFAGQTIEVGKVSATMDSEYLNITYALTGDWYLTETHLWVGQCDQLPVNDQGNPIIGSFPYQTTHDGNITTYTYQIPISSLPEGGYCISAHAVVVKKVDGVVVQKETMFAYGTDFEGKRWGWYYQY